MRLGITGICCALPIMLAGCQGSNVSLNYVDDDHHHRPAATHRPVYVDDHHHHVAQPVYVHADHVCSHDCHDHYYDGARVIVIGSGHRHHPGCGHDWDGRHWVVVGKAPATHHAHRPTKVHVDHAPEPAAHRVNPPPTKVARSTKGTHVHSTTCGCAYDRQGRGWVSVETGHVHGKNCGHIYVNGKWCLAR